MTEKLCRLLKDSPLCVHSIEIIRNGEILLHKAFDEDIPYPVYSAAKSVTSMGFSLCWDDGILSPDAILGDFQLRRDVRPHLLDVGAELRRLANDSGVHIADTVSPVYENSPDFSQEIHGICPFIGQVAVRKVKPDVAESRAPKERIHNRVGEHVRIGVAEQPFLIGYLHSPKNQFSSLHKSVNIVSGSHSAHFGLLEIT